jgi:Nucleotidyl transferase of unknown function (DUF2204)
MNALERTLVGAVRHLEARHVPYMVFGGLANLKWGRPRLTEDVDIKVLVESEQWKSFIEALREEYTPLPPDPLAFVQSTHVVPVDSREGVRIDFVMATLPYEKQAIDRAVRFAVEGVLVAWCTAEDLILHKIFSDRPRDREDVEGVVLRQRGDLDRAYLDPRVRELAGDLERPDILDF